MKKTAEEIHNELVERIESECVFMEEFRETPSDYRIGYYDALCFFLKWMEDDES